MSAEMAPSNDKLLTEFNVDGKAAEQPPVPRKSAEKVAKKLRDLFGDKALKERQCRNWFIKFRSGDFSLKYAQRSGRPSDVDEDIMKALLELDRHVTLREIEEKLNIPKSTVHDHINSLGLSKHDEAPQTTSKADIHQKKIMLSVWWGWKGVAYFELLQRNQTINSCVYCQQLDKLKTAINEKRPELINRKGVIFHQDNATPHTASVPRQKLKKLGWELLMHPQYSSDYASSDYHLFRYLQTSLNGKTFGNDEATKSHLVEFFANKGQKFYEELWNTYSATTLYIAKHQ
ncbi:histone-lysine N-methyltransferase SETMAR-like [Anastrepha obliqua]|uniref:histone-lysine N-methyltransferase SETMAR-like n=1 Tax=Anastrepha obliqua TaxID=95512 RepID=UPI0024095933|nr:histone-lysine N-methyltransferase SETMAR-like [Anastrepha obliqua]